MGALRDSAVFNWIALPFDCVFHCGQSELSMDSIRLAPSFALALGYPLYSLPDQPPWVMVATGLFIL